MSPGGDWPTLSMAQGAGAILLPFAHWETVGLASPEEEAAPSVLCAVFLPPSCRWRQAGKERALRPTAPLLSKQTGENEATQSPVLLEKEKGVEHAGATVFRIL